eukprot:354316-Chlamydomonas_euryale.AAC.10
MHATALELDALCCGGCTCTHGGHRQGCCPCTLRCFKVAFGELPMWTKPLPSVPALACPCSARCTEALPPSRPHAADFARSFGDRIVFERRLVRGGSGNVWRLLNAAGRPVPRFRPAEVLRYLGVNAANPLTIITQDMARSFLSGAPARA